MLYNHKADSLSPLSPTQTAPAEASKKDNTSTRKPSATAATPSARYEPSLDMAALDNAAAMDAPPQQQEDAFAAFRNAKHDPARREVSVVCVLFLSNEGRGWRSPRGHYFFTLPGKGSGV